MRPRAASRNVLSLTAVLGLAFALAPAPALAAGRTLVVNSTADLPDADPANGICRASNGRCTLRAAVMEADFTAGADTIRLPAGVFRLTRKGDDDAAPVGDAVVGDLDITSRTTLLGAGVGRTILDGNAPKAGSRVLDVYGVLIARDLTIRNGQAPPSSQGGGIRVAGTLTLTSTLIEGNRAANGGGLQASASFISIARSTVRANVSDLGGGVYMRDGSQLTVRDSVVYDNKATAAGGGIGLDGAGPATIERSAILANTAFDGGGLWLSGAPTSATATVTDSRINDNTATWAGGGVDAESGLIIMRSVLDANHAGAVGGAINIHSARDVLVEDSTLSRNTALDGGAIADVGFAPPTPNPVHVVANSTLSANRASHEGAGIHATVGATVTIADTTIAANVLARAHGQVGALRGGGIFTSDAAVVSAIHSLVADNYSTNGLTTVTPDDCFTSANSLGSLGHNLIETTTNCAIIGAATGDIYHADPRLGQLQGHGGPTETMALLAGSPAIDAGDSAGCAVPTDQRGVPRNQGARCDIGAFELSPSVSPLSAGARDGWVRESSERSGKGGARNAVATTLRVGDDAARRQFRSVLHFATTLPPAAIVVHAALRIRRQGQAGPVLDLVKAFGGLVVDARSPAFGSAALGLTDFQAAGALGVARFKAAPVDGWYTAEIPPAMINSTGTTQFRLRFRLDDNNNPVADYLRLFSGNAAAADRPVLVVEYYLR